MCPRSHGPLYKTLVSGIRTIIIDDPTSSMDERNRFYVIELMRYLLTLDAAQMFMFTHVWDDFSAISFNRAKNDDTALYEIVKRNGESSLVSCGLSSTPYKAMFKEIYEFSKMQESDPCFSELAIHIPNTMRRVLEEYLSFNGGISAVSANAAIKIYGVFYPDIQWGEASNNARCKIRRLINVTNIFSHRPPHVESNSEVYQVAKELMTIMRTTNKPHFDAMTE